jgi:hypothetical protein
MAEEQQNLVNQINDAIAQDDPLGDRGQGQPQRQVQRQHQQPLIIHDELGGEDYTYADAPGTATQAIINFSSTKGIKFHNKAVATFYPDKTMPAYDLSPQRLIEFIKEVRDRCYDYGTNSALEIPNDINDPNAGITHLCERPDFDYDKILAHFKSYINIHDCKRQNNFMVHKMLMNSLDLKAKAILRLDEAKYIIDGTPSGALLFKTIYAKATVDSRAEVNALKNMLQELPQYMMDVNSNIVKFNNHVRDVITRLAERGEKSSDLMTYLFKAYYQVQDKPFLVFIERIDQAHHYGRVATTPTALMETTETFYEDKVAMKLCGVSNAEQERLIALEARIDQATKAVQQGQKKINKQHQDGKKFNNKNHKQYKTHGWLTKGPAQGESQTKTVNGITYYWCEYHKRWTKNSNHTTATCRRVNVTKPDATTTKTSNTSAAKAAKAYQSVATESDNEPSDGSV